MFIKFIEFNSIRRCGMFDSLPATESIQSQTTSLLVWFNFCSEVDSVLSHFLTRSHDMFDSLPAFESIWNWPSFSLKHMKWVFEVSQFRVFSLEHWFTYSSGVVSESHHFNYNKWHAQFIFSGKVNSESNPFLAKTRHAWYPKSQLEHVLIDSESNHFQ